MTTTGDHSISRSSGRGFIVLACASLLALAGCEDGQQFSLFKPKGDAASAEATEGGGLRRSVKLVERDVEAPDVFQVTENGLWDGRPSLGGVWVAHPDVTDPERVIIRNQKNGKFVIGALFRRERENPGPKLQVSSDAAAAIGLLAGQPAKLNVTALRREEVAENGPAPDAAPQVTAPGEIKQTALAPAGGSAASASASKPAGAAAAAKPVKPQPKPAAKPASSALSKPYIQLGIFSVEQNANNTAQAMRVAGMQPSVKKSSSSGKTFWRVLVGPAKTSAERSALLKKVKASGFSDAYAVSN